MTSLAVSSMTEQDAQRLTERIRLTAHNYAEARTKLQELVTEAKSGNAHLALGYASWTAYLADVLGEEPMRLARGERQEMVQMLSAEGVSREAIATITGVAERTIQRDMQEETFVSPSKVTGLDGKTYTRPEPAEPIQPKRTPLPEQYFNAIYDLGKLIDRIERLTEDDRFGRNKKELQTKHRHDLARHQAKLAELIHKLSN